MLNSKIWFIEGFLQSFKAADSATPHITPIADMFFVIEFKIFGLNFIQYLVTSISVHIFTSIVLALLVFEMTRSKLTTLISTIFFAFNSIHSEAITWIMASLNTELAVFFGLASLLFLQKSFVQKKTNTYLFLGYLSLLFSLWSKETAVIFILAAAFLMWKNRSKLEKKFHFKLFSIVLIIFLLTELVGRRAQIHFQSSIGTNSPLLYRVFDLYYEINPALLIFRCMSLFLKMLAQSIIPVKVISSLSIVLTDFQFPFFNQEKAVGGTTYVNFIQSPMPEMISYILGLFVLFFILVSKKLQLNKLFTWGVAYWFLGLLPILSILVGFPWLAYSPYVGSRHFYHLMPGLALSVGIVVTSLAKWVKIKKNERVAQLFLCLITFSYIYVQYRVQAFDTLTRKKAADFTARKNIVETLVKDLDPIPKKTIIYTTSNRNYYGFGLLMLPFQTAFSHMLPVIFSENFNLHGLLYPSSFYSNEYFKDSTDGLATQGYFEENGYGLGYFLEKPKLIRALEHADLGVEYVYAYRFNGDDNTFSNMTDELRSELSRVLESRMMFRKWRTEEFPDDFFLFQVDPNWLVKKQETSYSIFDERNKPILEIEIFRDMKKVNFFQFVTDQVVEGKKIDTKIGTDTLNSDLGLSRVKYYPNWNENIFFVAGGRGTTFYRFKVFQKEEAKLIYRTLEFVD
ncbi:MAG: hypothetical protein ABI425_00880 [Patescibacteria group bacterium]